MRPILLAAVAACFALPALSAQVAVFETKDVRIVLSDDKCRIPELAQMFKERTGKDAMAADVSFEGRSLQACWVPYQGAVALVDEDGDGGILPVEAFQKVKLI